MGGIEWNGFVSERRRIHVFSSLHPLPNRPCPHSLLTKPSPHITSCPPHPHFLICINGSLKFHQMVWSQFGERSNGMVFTSVCEGRNRFFLFLAPSSQRNLPPRPLPNPSPTTCLQPKAPRAESCTLGRDHARSQFKNN